MAQDEPIEIRGVVVPVAWDAQGRVVAAGLAGVDEEEYLLTPGRPEAQVLGLVQHEVVVRGRLCRRPDGRKQINVESLRIHARK
ncbi:MAG: hypothetical protein ACOZHQ_00550 [Thermodesulfobacteriota bacterium]